jgi:hypothetical protein
LFFVVVLMVSVSPLLSSLSLSPDIIFWCY